MTLRVVDEEREGAMKEYVRTNQGQSGAKGVGETYLWGGECTNRIEPDVQGRSKLRSQ